MKYGITENRFTLGKIVATGAREFRANLWSILFIFLIVYLPINYALSYISVDWSEGPSGIRDYLRISLLCENLFGVLATMSLAFLVEASLKGTPLTPAQALGRALSRWPAALLTAILSAAILLALCCLLIIPGIIWSVYYVFVIYAVALREKIGLDALRYSKALVKGHWWGIAGCFIFIEVLRLLTMLLLAFISALLGPEESRLFELLSDTATDISSAPFIAMIIVLFLNRDALAHSGAPQEEPAPGLPASSNQAPDIIEPR
ncbi:MAG: hypothetical protein AB1921_08895 [Thermodesulfobacteriota bacterium]